MTIDERAFRDALASVLRSLVGERRQNPKALARLTGIDYYAMRRTLFGSRDPSLWELRKLAEVLETSVDALIRRADQLASERAAEVEAIEQGTEEELG